MSAQKVPETTQESWHRAPKATTEKAELPVFALHTSRKPSLAPRQTYPEKHLAAQNRPGSV